MTTYRFLLRSFTLLAVTAVLYFGAAPMSWESSSVAPTAPIDTSAETAKYDCWTEGRTDIPGGALILDMGEVKHIWDDAQVGKLMTRALKGDGGGIISFCAK